MSIKIVETKYGKVACYPWAEYAAPGSANMQQVAQITGAVAVLLMREGKEDLTVEEAEAVLGHMQQLKPTTH